MTVTMRNQRQFLRKRSLEPREKMAAVRQSQFRKFLEGDSESDTKGDKGDGKRDTESDRSDSEVDNRRLRFRAPSSTAEFAIKALPRDERRGAIGAYALMRHA